MRVCRVVMAAIVVLCAAAGNVMAAPTVSNVRASQRVNEKIVDIFYDLANPNGGSHYVHVAAKANGAAIRIAAVSGAVGSGVQPGNNLHIVWNLGADYNGMFSDSGRVRVIATDFDATNTDMVYISPGVNGVTVTQAYYIGRYEVRKDLWDQVYAWGVANGYSFSAGSSHSNLANRPIVNISWYDVVKWCNARSEREGLMPNYYVGYEVYRTGQVLNSDWKMTANGFHLPTEAEWEYAARGGLSGMTYPWGNTIDCTRANYNNCLGYASAVGSYAPNGFGLYDVAGNVWEWCWNWYTLNSYRALRGGNWDNAAAYCAVSYRNGLSPGNMDSNMGFRLARLAGP